MSLEASLDHEDSVRVVLDKYGLVLDERLTADEVYSGLPILNPVEINAFLQGSVKFEDNGRYNRIEWDDLRSIGVFVSRLIQKSYDAGNKDFVLNTKGLPDIHYLGKDLKGAADRPLVVRIEGDAGFGCGDDSEGSSFDVQGSVGNYCGNGSIGSSFVVQGNAGMGFGYGSKGSSFSFHGNVEQVFSGRDSSKGSSYSSSSKEVYSQLNEIVPYGNRVFLIDSQGNVLKESLFRRVLNFFIV